MTVNQLEKKSLNVYKIAWDLVNLDTLVMQTIGKIEGKSAKEKYHAVRVANNRLNRSVQKYAKKLFKLSGK